VFSHLFAIDLARYSSFTNQNGKQGQQQEEGQEHPDRRRNGDLAGQYSIHEGADHPMALGLPEGLSEGRARQKEVHRSLQGVLPPGQGRQVLCAGVQCL